MKKEFTPLDLDEVIHAEDNPSPLRQLAQAETFKVKFLLERLERNVTKQLLEGIECEVMKIDQPGWQKGTIRIKQIELEFCPDSLEESVDENSPLDELRNTTMN
jgi:hypothetical protein